MFQPALQNGSWHFQHMVILCFFFLLMLHVFCNFGYIFIYASTVTGATFLSVFQIAHFGFSDFQLLERWDFAHVCLIFYYFPYKFFVSWTMKYSWFCIPSFQLILGSLTRNCCVNCFLYLQMLLNRVCNPIRLFSQMLPWKVNISDAVLWQICSLTRKHTAKMFS